MASIYTGLERILRALAAYHGVPEPTGEHWHAALMRLFCEPAAPPLPVLFDSSLEADLFALRGFRHVARHTYAFDLDQARLLEGMRRTPRVVSSVRVAVEAHVHSLE